MTFKAQSLRSHALYLLIKELDLLFTLRRLRFPSVRFAHLVECLLNGKFRGFGHGEFLVEWITGLAADQRNRRLPREPCENLMEVNANRNERI